jgi:hypothetical protein
MGEIEALTSALSMLSDELSEGWDPRTSFGKTTHTIQTRGRQGSLSSIDKVEYKVDKRRSTRSTSTDIHPANFHEGFANPTPILQINEPSEVAQVIEKTHRYW